MAEKYTNYKPPSIWKPAISSKPLFNTTLSLRSLRKRVRNMLSSSLSSLKGKSRTFKKSSEMQKTSKE